MGRSIAAPLLQRFDRLELVAIGLVGALTAVTVAMLVAPGVAGHIVAPGLDLVLDTVATVVTGTVAVLVWTRYMEYREPVDHATAAAFLALAMVNGVAVFVAVTGGPDTGDGPVHVGQDQAYVFAAGRLLAAGLLVYGGAASLRGLSPRLPIPMLLAPAIVLALVIGVLETIGDTLPPLLVSAHVDAGGPTSDVVTTGFGAIVQLAGAALMLTAAVIWHRLWRRDRSKGQAYVALSLLVASFAQLHTVIFPGIHPVAVSTGDLLWLVAGAMLVLAIEAGSRATFKELRSANVALAELREIDLERAALEERARVSRELHDGLAQELWLAKLKAGRLQAMPGLDPEALVLCDELAASIDHGLAEARQAVMALRLGSDDEHAPLCQMLHLFVDDFADRFGVRTDFECDHSTPRISHRAEAELLRIAQEALSNVRRHADATRIRVRFETVDSMVNLTVSDNGKGFDAASLDSGGYGLTGMRERAALIKGLLTIQSRPLDGTSVTVQVPVGPSVVTVRSRT